MRISSSYYTRTLPAQMSEQNSKIAQTQQQIASGRKFLQPSDDPSGAGNLILFQQTAGHLKQYERNAQFAETRLALEESTLDSVGNTLLSIREIGLKVNNDSNGPADRAVMLHELTQLKSHMVSLANSVDAHGQFLFSGGSADSPAYSDAGTISYQGDSNTQSVQIAVGSDLIVRTPGNEIFEYDGVGGRESLFDTITELEVLLGPAGTPPADDAFHTQIGAIIEELDVGYQHILGVRSGTGTRLASIDQARESNDSVARTVETQVADVLDVDLVEAISRMESEVQTLQAIQATYGKLQSLSLFNVI